MRKLTKLPSSLQEWAHSTSSVAQMHSAMTDHRITAVEADILIGTAMGNLENSGIAEPIMAHPPDRESDMSFAHFMNLAMQNKQLQKHVKLDFKEIETTQPCLDILRNLTFESNGKFIFLNADIIPGPGRTHEDITVSASHFLDQCHCVISSMRKVSAFQCSCIGNARNLTRNPPPIMQVKFAFSLGWKVDVCSISGHTEEQVAEMINLIRAYKLSESAGIVLAVNARLLSKNMPPFESFLDKHPDSQLLCWVGSGEPPIAMMKVNRIQKHFRRHGSIERIGFDVQVRDEWSRTRCQFFRVAYFMPLCTRRLPIWPWVQHTMSSFGLLVFTKSCKLAWLVCFLIPKLRKCKVVIWLFC